ncbi:MAG TPA: hypothetical protein VFO86_01585, partial [Terriglobia bacterium]|nr:hypothetical protein [Terriglobia bacterium]
TNGERYPFHLHLPRHRPVQLDVQIGRGDVITARLRDFQGKSSLYDSPEIFALGKFCLGCVTGSDTCCRGAVN